jgi:tRNA threonylcarbamoyl adenosine modification protein YeaZ
MKILALDFSSSQRSVAVVQPLSGAEPVFQSEIIEAGGRSTKAFSMIERALCEARLDREAIECIAVGLGPGSYTGIRAAIALAQGWQLARDVKVLGISTVDVLGAQAQADGLRGQVHIVVDAQRGEFYCSTWDLSDAERVETAPLCIVKREEVETRIATEEPVIGPDLKRVFPEVRETFPSALALGNRALGRADFVPGEHLKPVYLRETTFVKAPPPRPLK